MQRIPILEYAAPVWSPFLQCQIYQIEKIQRNMARFVLNDYSQYSSATNMINHLSWPTLTSRQIFLKLLSFYKIVKNLVETSTAYKFSAINKNYSGTLLSFLYPFNKH